jgi:hypothetical protein
MLTQLSITSLYFYLYSNLLHCYTTTIYNVTIIIDSAIYNVDTASYYVGILLFIQQPTTLLYYNYLLRYYTPIDSAIYNVDTAIYYVTIILSNEFFIALLYIHTINHTTILNNIFAMRAPVLSPEPAAGGPVRSGKTDDTPRLCHLCYHINYRVFSFMLLDTCRTEDT